METNDCDIGYDRNVLILTDIHKSVNIYMKHTKYISPMPETLSKLINGIWSEYIKYSCVDTCQ